MKETKEANNFFRDFAKETSTVRWRFGEYTKEDLMQMDPVSLRALLHERTHHTIEVPLYPILLKEKGEPIKGFGRQAQLVLDVWRERGFTEDEDDIQWVKRYLAIAKKVQAGEKVVIDEPLPEPFTNDEMKVVEKLIYRRRSIRDWITKEVPNWMIEKILDAGRVAPIGCNLNDIRFIVLRDPEEKKMIHSDIATNNCVIIVICHDARVPKIVGQDRTAPQNVGFDAAATADHILLMAHALGLGAVWLTFGKATEKTPDRSKEFAQKYGLPDYIEADLHIAVGWTAIGSIKAARMPLNEMMIQRNT